MAAKDRFSLNRGDHLNRFLSVHFIKILLFIGIYICKLVTGETTFPSKNNIIHHKPDPFTYHPEGNNYLQVSLDHLGIFPLISFHYSPNKIKVGWYVY